MSEFDLDVRIVKPGESASQPDAFPTVGTTCWSCEPHTCRCCSVHAGCQSVWTACTCQGTC
jgi:hypothetical protein